MMISHESCLDGTRQLMNEPELSSRVKSRMILGEVDSPYDYFAINTSRREIIALAIES